MDLSLKYSELERIVRDSSGTELKFSYTSSDTVHLAYPLKIMGMTNEVGLELRVVGIYGNDVHLLLLMEGAGGMMNMALKMASGIIREKVGGVATFGSDNDVTVHLDNIPKLEQILKHMEISGVCFNQEAAILMVNMK